MFSTRWSIGLNGFESARGVRERVFVAGRKIPAGAEFDALDGYAAHLFVFEEDGAPIAAGRMYPDGDFIVIDRVAVEEARRAEPFADLVLRLLLFKAQEMPQSAIKVIADGALSPMLPAFGFVPAGLPRLTPRGEMQDFTCPTKGIVWDSPCRHTDSSK